MLQETMIAKTQFFPLSNKLCLCQSSTPPSHCTPIALTLCLLSAKREEVQALAAANMLKMGSSPRLSACTALTPRWLKAAGPWRDSLSFEVGGKLILQLNWGKCGPCPQFLPLWCSEELATSDSHIFNLSPFSVSSGSRCGAPIP